jgi:hypothetical protein
MKRVFFTRVNHGQTHKTTYQAKVAKKKHKTLCYEYKNVISLKKADVWYVAI